MGGISPFFFVIAGGVLTFGHTNTSELEQGRFVPGKQIVSSFHMQFLVRVCARLELHLVSRTNFKLGKEEEASNQSSV